ncbi:MAG TPA: (d)CMP kinase [Actinomycetota bacterium]|nr:(d)CMP kinase [Actinomycetota bacterium]
MIIAVDGPAGSGKSTIAAAVAERLSVSHIDTGAMYRALALKVLRSDLSPGDEAGVCSLLGSTDVWVADGRVVLDGEEVQELIREPEVTAASSRVAEHQPVRHWMVERQRRVVHGAAGGAVVEGRDIGTVVLPDADLKIYLTASEEQRAHRRSLQRGASEAQALQEVSSRDSRDMTRRYSPLRPADDAVLIDTTRLSIDETVESVLNAMRERLQP